jgi:hypothetical protein
MVPKVRVSLTSSPFGPGVRQQATTDFLCMSNPAQCVYVTSIVHLASIGHWSDASKRQYSL